MSLVFHVPLSVARPVLILENPGTNDRDTILPIATPPLISSSEAPKGKTTQEKEQQQDTDGRGHAHEQPFQPQGSL